MPIDSKNKGTHSTIDFVLLVFGLQLLYHEQSMIEQVHLKISAVTTLSVATSLIERTLVNQFTTFLPQSKILAHHTVISFPGKSRDRRLTTCSPGLKTSCWSNSSKLKRFSVLPVSTLTFPKNSLTKVMTWGKVVLSGLSSGVNLSTASRSKGYRARRVVGFVR